jgi:undecaprenyl-diphosphatase
MATLAVSLFVLIAYAALFSGEPGPTTGDTAASEFVESIRAGWLVDIAKVVTALGSAAAVLPLAAVCAGLLAWRGRWAEVCVLLAGLALIVLGGHEIKAAVDRPRPAGGLVATSGSSYPSMHAAYSTFYVWLALTVVLRLRVGMARGAAVIVAGIVLAALIGLSRVYLGVHYLSDVSGGWALGIAAFSLCAAVALVVTTVWNMRHNSADVAAPGAAEDRK